MIKSLTLKNFQSHKESKLVFSPNFSVIVGPSDHGKSSIIRAIEWVRSNRPTGNSFLSCFLREGEDLTTVILENDVGKIIRKRDKKTTGSYKTHINGKVGNYSVLGNDVPETVTEILNLLDINIQMQLDSHYLILQTPGQAAKYLNEITKLDKLTNALDNVKRKSTKASSDINELDRKIDNANQYLESGIQDILKELEFIQKTMTRCMERRTTVVNSINQLQKILSEIKWIKGKIKDDKEIQKAGKVIANLGKLVAEAEDIQEEYDWLEKIINKNKQLQIGIEDGKKRMGTITKDILELQKQLSECPYCGGKLTEKTKQHLLKEVDNG